MALTWILSEIRAKVRVLIAQPSSETITDDTIDNNVNDFYQNVFPTVVDVDELRGYITQLLTATDSGQYTLSSVHHLQPKPKLDGADIQFYLDEDEFFGQFPQDTGSAHIISDNGAGLQIGSTSSSAVKNANTFYYDIAGKSYTKDSAETELSGDTIPQDKYGAWRLEINASGTISIVEASDNGTGYDTPGLAVQALENESSAKAALGYVTAINTGGTFVPGTTSLSAGTVTATYTNGWNSSRNDPLAVLWYAQILYVRPKSDDWHELRIPYIKKPTALTSSTAPTDVRWGPILAYGTAIEILISEKDNDGVDLLRPELVRLVNIISSRTIQQKQDRRVKVRY